jgi:hypothetical protein
MIAASVREGIQNGLSVKYNEVNTTHGSHNQTVQELITLQQMICDSLAMKSSMATNPNVRAEMPQGIESVSPDFCAKFANISSLPKAYGQWLDRHKKGEETALLRTHEILLEDFYMMHKQHTDVLMNKGMLALQERLSADWLPHGYETNALQLFSADARATQHRMESVVPLQKAWIAFSDAKYKDWILRLGIGGAVVLATGAGGALGYLARASLAEVVKHPYFLHYLAGGNTIFGGTAWNIGLFDKILEVWDEPRGENPSTKLLFGEFTDTAHSFSKDFDRQYKSLLMLVDTVIEVQGILEQHTTDSTTWDTLKQKLNIHAKDLSTSLEHAGISNAKLVDCDSCNTSRDVQAALQYTTQVADCGLSGNSTQCKQPANDTWRETQTVSLLTPFVTRNNDGNPEGVISMGLFHPVLLGKFSSILKEWKDFIDTSLEADAVSELSQHTNDNIPYLTLKPKLVEAIAAVASIQQQSDAVIRKMQPHVVSQMVFPKRGPRGHLDQANLLKSMLSKEDALCYAQGVTDAAMQILSHRNMPKNIGKFTALDFDAVHTESRQTLGLGEDLFQRVQGLTGDVLLESLKLAWDVLIARE